MAKAKQNGHSLEPASIAGELLAARLEQLEITSSELADLMGYPLWAVQAIIRGEAIIPRETASLLQQALDGSPNLRDKKGYGQQEFLAANPVRPVRKYNPDYVTPLGETLEETLEAKGMTHEELANRMGDPLSTISEIISGDIPVTPEIAIQLEQALDVPASFWNNRERRYRESLARRPDSVVVAA